VSLLKTFHCIVDFFRRGGDDNDVTPLLNKCLSNTESNPKSVKRGGREYPEDPPMTTTFFPVSLLLKDDIGVELDDGGETLLTLKDFRHSGLNDAICRHYKWHVQGG
jgi:hypothetical protein